ncbi:MAG TPA: hypothetical protein VEA99_06695 [Gemmatimonadaceae bacterium]|nr:hypothetical protein [Gemmatimonadaceae bacterium]
MPDHTPEIPPERGTPRVPERENPGPAHIPEPWQSPQEPVRKINLPPDSPSPGVEVPGKDNSGP